VKEVRRKKAEGRGIESRVRRRGRGNRDKQRCDITHE